MVWILVAIVVVGFLVAVLVRESQPRHDANRSVPPSSWQDSRTPVVPPTTGYTITPMPPPEARVYGTDLPPPRPEYRPRTIGPRGPARLSAKEVLSRLDELRQAGAQWDVIWARLNPTDDPDVQRLLVEIRGPHMFAPHLALSAIEVGCQRALAKAPDADALAALQLATHDDRFWR